MCMRHWSGKSKPGCKELGTSMGAPKRVRPYAGSKKPKCAWLLGTNRGSGCAKSVATIGAPERKMP